AMRPTAIRSSPRSSFPTAATCSSAATTASCASGLAASTASFTGSEGMPTRSSASPSLPTAASPSPGAPTVRCAGGASPTPQRAPGELEPGKPSLGRPDVSQLVLLPVENRSQAATPASKLRGQYYPPDDLVAMMFDACELTPRHLILDPACGDGNFLCGA